MVNTIRVSTRTDSDISSPFHQKQHTRCAREWSTSRHTRPSGCAQTHAAAHHGIHMHALAFLCSHSFPCQHRSEHTARGERAIITTKDVDTERACRTNAFHCSCVELFLSPPLHVCNSVVVLFLVTALHVCTSALPSLHITSSIVRLECTCVRQHKSSERLDGSARRHVCRRAAGRPSSPCTNHRTR